MAATINTGNPPSTVGGYGGAYISAATGIQVMTTGGYSNAYNLSAAQVIKAAPGRLAKIVINGVVGTGGSLTFNDCLTVAAAAATNQIYTTAGTIAVGTVVTLEWPCTAGIVCSAVPTGGTVAISVSFA